MYAIYAYIGVVLGVNVGILWHTWSVWVSCFASLRVLKFTSRAATGRWLRCALARPTQLMFAAPTATATSQLVAAQASSVGHRGAAHWSSTYKTSHDDNAIVGSAYHRRAINTAVGRWVDGPAADGQIQKMRPIGASSSHLGWLNGE